MIRTVAGCGRPAQEYGRFLMPCGLRIDTRRTVRVDDEMINDAHQRHHQDGHIFYGLWSLKYTDTDGEMTVECEHD